MSDISPDASRNAQVYCTMVLTDNYLKGALVVARQLHVLDPSRSVVCLITPSTLSEPTVTQIRQHFDDVIYLNPVDAGESPELSLLDRPELRMAVTKIRLWSLNYTRIVYVDADTLILKSIADLFEGELPPGMVAASPDCGWPDIFNSGVMALSPSTEVESRLIESLVCRGSFDGSDQGLFNEVLEWRRLPFIYNVTVNAGYEYTPAYRRFEKDIKVLHFIGPSKPWDSRDLSRETQLWWKAWNETEHPSRTAPVSDAISTVPGKSTQEIQRILTEASARHKYDSEKIVTPPLDYWNAKSHEPIRNSRPEGEQMNQPPVEKVTLKDKVHEFPQFGDSLVVLPFENDMKPAERMF